MVFRLSWHFLFNIKGGGNSEPELSTYVSQANYSRNKTTKQRNNAETKWRKSPTIYWCNECYQLCTAKTRHKPTSFQTIRLNGAGTIKHHWKLIGLAFIVQCIVVVTGENKYEKVNDGGLTDGILLLLNGTFFDLKENVCALQSKVAVLETKINRSDSLPNVCNDTVLTEIKRLLTKELQAFSKIQDGFENSMRILQKEQQEIRTLINSTCRQGNKDSDKDREYGSCTDGWITAPTKCYYVSTESERANSEYAVAHCGTIDSKLAEFRNDEEANYVFQLMPERVGLRDYLYTGETRTNDDIWSYLSDLQPVYGTARSWAPDEPGGSPEDCGCVSKEDVFKMTDCHCVGFELLFICEKPRETL